MAMISNRLKEAKKPKGEINRGVLLGSRRWEYIYEMPCPAAMPPPTVWVDRIGGQKNE
jgi:hypothetical protein